MMNNFKQDIQSPIENIGAGIFTLNQNKNTLEKHNRDSAELIYREYRNLQRNIDKLVDLSKFNTRNVLLNHQDINFEELVENAISLCKSSDFENPDLNFKINTQAIHLIITCDRDKIFQCLEYLIRNAIHFTKKGTIEVLLENQDTVINESMTSTIKCSIIDEGIGIPEDELQNIFGPFTQSSYTKGKNYGKGLGLALCQRIIALHHGIIWAENNKTKPGSTFSFIIPITQIS